MEYKKIELRKLSESDNSGYSLDDWEGKESFSGYMELAGELSERMLNGRYKGKLLEQDFEIVDLDSIREEQTWSDFGAMILGHNLITSQNNFYHQRKVEATVQIGELNDIE